MIKGSLYYDHSAQAFIAVLLFFFLIGTDSTWAQTANLPTQNFPPSIENGTAGTGQGAPSESPPRSHVGGWLNRSGLGLLIVLTPFATGVTLLILLLIILSLIVRAVKPRKGYFKTVPYQRQRRYA